MNKALAILILLSAVAAGWAVLRMDDAAAAAATARDDLADCQQFLATPERKANAAELGLFGGTAATPTTDSGGSSNGHLETGIRQAVTATGLSDNLRNIEWTNVSAPGSEETAEVRGFLHLEDVTLEQLTRFLHQLSEADPRSRTQMIELTAPPAEAVTGSESAERWAADVTLAYRMRPASRRPNG